MTESEADKKQTADGHMTCYYGFQYLPDDIVLRVFSHLAVDDVAHAACTCHQWSRVAQDDLLWRDLFYRRWKVVPATPMAPGATSWRLEFKRLLYHSPAEESEVLARHKDQVLHVSFSHRGEMFATCSKDGTVKVWTSGYPVSLKFEQDMNAFTWKYTQFSKFNDSDTLLLVSGVHFGAMSNSGEIAVFSLTDNFELQCRVLNKPYDVFGTWYDDSQLLSGNLYWTGQVSSCTALWLNKASQETESEHASVIMRLFRFNNNNASSIRTIMVSRHCDDPGDKLLIFTMGSQTYTPHQIGVKRIQATEAMRSFSHGQNVSRDGVPFLLPAVDDADDGRAYDTVDKIFDMDGHIIGMSLSPDQRYLFVNSRPWPKGFVISNPLQPPAIAQEIDIHVIDLHEMKEVGVMLQSHKAYTANDECFFIFLDVCDSYVASGAEDRHGYIWDRHYGVCLRRFPHTDVVNCVAFNPADQEVLVTVSDDFTVKVWRSKNKQRQIKAAGDSQTRENKKCKNADDDGIS